VTSFAKALDRHRREHPGAYTASGRPILDGGGGVAAIPGDPVALHERREMIEFNRLGQARELRRRAEALERG
jgi:hypothetical protein